MAMKYSSTVPVDDSPLACFFAPRPVVVAGTAVAGIGAAVDAMGPEVLWFWMVSVAESTG